MKPKLKPMDTVDGQWTMDEAPHCCRWGYVTIISRVYPLTSITLASALKSTVELAIAVLPYT